MSIITDALSGWNGEYTRRDWPNYTGKITVIGKSGRRADYWIKKNKEQGIIPLYRPDKDFRPTTNDDWGNQSYEEFPNWKELGFSDPDEWLGALHAEAIIAAREAWDNDPASEIY